MVIRTLARPMPFAGSQLGDIRHVCAHGAVECLFKAFSEAALLDTLNARLG